ncbi:Soluble aldose sugar dehydrogenase YliI precursor [Tsuneonella dongtanensis]|uniref:Soluble aldose sugar dehydrogenase YliI n=1 Tax=Tsuneonella dongtanensis TaxID=692370 RepID=A0A1B2ADD5_9SPHN|nr:PQQ-dependent sugar dehydrogenase [Tsuneonella dongtanensis]ANY20108.1 Soluble aldose sugar dehydrogenase YliI precursor [Tsuneonella dongtanensis]
MTMRPTVLALVSLSALAAASCGAQTTGDTPGARSTQAPVSTMATPFAIKPHGAYNEPWAAAFAPGTPVLFITEKSGTMKFFDTRAGRGGTVTGLPTVDSGGQGGLGDIAFLPSEKAATLSRRTIYLTWAEAGPDDTRGAVLGRGTLVCEEADACRIDGMTVIWRQPKVSGRGHYSHRIAIAPDGKSIFLASGDRQKMDPAQDTANNLGSVVRLNLDGTPAAGNTFSGQAGKAQDIWSFGHRNILGLQFDAQGRLWDLEHGPAGGDELNLVTKGANYGWPVVSEGKHYDGRAIPAHSTRPEFAAPAISWNPVIAPGDFVFYSGKLWPEWKGQALIAGMKPASVVRVGIDGTRATELARYAMDKRIREIVEGPDGALWLLEDKAGGRLLELRPNK